MASYSRMSAFYDVIMTAGYYDYEQIVSALGRAVAPRGGDGDEVLRVLELGCGTGLILAPFATRFPDVELTGLDLTADMLDQARDRLVDHANVTLVHADVLTASLDPGFDVVYSYGGIWYFVPAGSSYALVSHLRDDADNRTGLTRVAGWMRPGARLLLGIQDAHRSYERALSDDLVYAQSVDPIDDGFRKRYGLWAGPEQVMDQTIDYRTYEPPDAVTLLGDAGFDLVARPDLVAEPHSVPLFVELVRR